MTSEAFSTHCCAEDDVASEPRGSSYHPGQPPLDFDELLQRCLGNRELARRVLAKFQTHFAGELQVMRQRFEAGDWEEVGRLAHRVHGSSANVAARELSRLARDLEDQARRRLHCEASQTLGTLETQWQRFQTFVGAA